MPPSNYLMSTLLQGSSTPEAQPREASGASSERDVPFTTLSGDEIKPLYTEADLPTDMDASVGLPGAYPFTRGSSPASGRLRRRTSASTTCSTTGRRACRRRSTCRP
jgi:methylmalonyl-CoA mutase N-terminal domain/subunit